MQEAEEKSLVIVQANRVAALEMPKLIAEAGPAAGFAWEELFLGRIRNGYTRRA